MRFEHIGWITNRPDLFEKFWCEIMGFELVKSASITAEMAFSLFGIESAASINRYRHPDYSCDI